MKCVRVMTKTQKITLDRDEAEKNINVEVFGLNAMRKGAQMAQQGDYTQARLQTYSAARCLNRNINSSEQKAAFTTWVDQVDRMDERLRDAQQREIVSMNSAVYSDEAINREQEQERERSRRRDREEDDGLSTALYQMKSAGNKTWK